MKHKILLIVIVLLAAILRLYNLGHIPRGLYIDEPSLGYNAYTILKSGTDEYGTRYPLAFKSFGEFKLPVYIYGSVPIIALIGLSPFSIRLLSALAGITATLWIYLLTKKLTVNSTYLHPQKTSLIAAALWSVSIWNIQLSRAAFEANLMVTIVIFAAYFLVKFIDSQKIIQGLIACVLFILSLYTYNAARLFVPLFLGLTLIVYRPNIPKLKSSIVMLLLIFACIPAFIGLISNNENARLKQVMELGNKEFMLGPVLGVTQKYLSHLSPDFLFFKGDPSTPRHSVPELGLLYFPEIISIGLGLIALFQHRIRYAKLIGLWLLLAPLPAAFATPTPHALRSSLLLPPLIILSAIGIYTGIDYFQHNLRPKMIRLVAFALISLGAIYSIYTYLHVYYLHYQYRVSWDWTENITLVAEYLTTTYPEPNHTFIIEGNSLDLIYYKFFNASHNRPTDQSKYLFVENGSPITPQNNDVVAISGWKSAPSELKDLKELKMMNNSSGYKVGVWQK